MGDRRLATMQPSGAGELDSLVGSLSASELSSLQFPFFPGGDEFNSIGLRSDQEIFSEPMHQEKMYQVDFCCQPQQIPEKHFHAEHICAQEEIAHEQEPEWNGENFQLLRDVLPLSFPAIVIVVPSTPRLVPLKLTTVASRPKIRKMPVDFPEGLFVEQLSRTILKQVFDPSSMFDVRICFVDYSPCREVKFAEYYASKSEKASSSISTLNLSDDTRSSASSTAESTDDNKSSTICTKASAAGELPASATASTKHLIESAPTSSSRQIESSTSSVNTVSTTPSSSIVQAASDQTSTIQESASTESPSSPVSSAAQEAKAEAPSTPVYSYSPILESVTVPPASPVTSIFVTSSIASSVASTTGSPESSVAAAKLSPETSKVESIEPPPSTASPVVSSNATGSNVSIVDSSRSSEEMKQSDPVATILSSETAKVVSTIPEPSPVSPISSSVASTVDSSVGSSASSQESKKSNVIATKLSPETSKVETTVDSSSSNAGQSSSSVQPSPAESSKTWSVPSAIVDMLKNQPSIRSDLPPDYLKRIRFTESCCCASNGDVNDSATIAIESSQATYCLADDDDDEYFYRLIFTINGLSCLQKKLDCPFLCSCCGYGKNSNDAKHTNCSQRSLDKSDSSTKLT